MMIDVPLRPVCEVQQLSQARTELLQSARLPSSRFPATKTLVQQQTSAGNVVSLWQDARGRALRYVKVWSALASREAVFSHPTPVLPHACLFREEIQHFDSMWYALGPLFKSWRHAQALIELFIEETQQLDSASSGSRFVLQDSASSGRAGGAPDVGPSTHASVQQTASLTYYMPSFDYSCDSHDAAAAKARHTLTGSSSESEDTSRCRKDQELR